MNAMTEPISLANYTDRARKVLCLARRNADALGHKHIGTEHLLLGLIEEGSGIAAYVLRSEFRIGLESVRLAVLTVLANNKHKPDPAISDADVERIADVVVNRLKRGLNPQDAGDAKMDELVEKIRRA